MMDTIGFDDEPPPEPRDGWLLVRIHVPELNVLKCLQFPADRLVWDIKQQVLASLPKELKESFNYGLFCPPSNGKAGKFLDEERRLGDYPFNGPVGYLELKYKRRVYKMLNLDERQLKALHTRANLRRFLDCVNGGHVEKIAKMCSKGLDPNFHCPETGETPLTIATNTRKPSKLLIALVNGGAIIDYRTKDGSTSLHKAVERDCLEAVTTLLELGASPNYRDGRGLTPLYLSVTRKTDPKICECLLHDHAITGTQDAQGWQEVHQACRNGLAHHLEHLLFYGADMDGRNASGNTPLHVCAVNNQEACTRMLLFRGAQRGALNYANQTPYQVAVIAGNLELAEMIQNYKMEDIVPFRGPPRYNPRRRSGLGCWGTTLMSSSSSQTGSLLRHSMLISGNIGISCNINGGGPPSPCPSEHPFSSASSSLSEGSSSHRSHEDDISIVTDKSLGDTSDIISDSSGVGTSSDSTACSIGHPSTTVVCMEKYIGTNEQGHLNIQPGDVIEVVGSTDCGLLEGYIRGTNRIGFFPSQYVQEVNIRQKNIINVSTATLNQHQMNNLKNPMAMLNAHHHQYHHNHKINEEQEQLQQQSQFNNNNNISNISVNNNNNINNNINNNSNNNNNNGNNSSNINNNNIIINNHHQQYSSATAPRIKKPGLSDPRTVILHRAKRGFGFVLRGAKASSPLMQLKPSERCPALQYLDSVDPGGVADMAGLKPGDFLIEINNEDVRCASHEHVVELIRTSGALVSMTVVSQSLANGGNAIQQFNQQQQQMNEMNNGLGAPLSARQCATLPRRMPAPGKLPAPAPPRRDPKTTLSVGRARAKSMVAGLEGGGDKDEDDLTPTTKSSSAESIHQQSLSAVSTPTQGGPGTPVQPRTASIKARPTSSRITAAELEELFQRQQGESADNNRYSTMMTTSRFQSGLDSGTTTPPTSPQRNAGGPIVYASVADMKRKKTKNGTLRGKACSIPSISDLKRTFHSTPDLAATTMSNSSLYPAGGSVFKGHRSQDDVYTIHASMQRLNLPPPNHPPPPPPTVGQVVKVDISRRSSEYESTLALQQSILQQQKQMINSNTGSGNNIGKGNQDNSGGSADSNEIMSSFRPAANAKLYASPQDIRTVGYRPRLDQNIRNQIRKTASLRSTVNPNQQVQQSAPMNNINGGNINPYAQPLRPVTSNGGAQMAQHQQLRMSKSDAVTQQQVMPTTNTGNVINAPPIPDPDYSLSESDDDDNSVMLATRNVKLNVNNNNAMPQNTIQQQQLQPHQQLHQINDQIETSGNSNTSGSSSGSSSVPHSFSVDELQKMRSKLKASKSYPNDLLIQQQQQLEQKHQHHEEGDNSSSGVSSDQEIPINNGSNDLIKPNKLDLRKINNNNSNINTNTPISSSVTSTTQSIASALTGKVASQQNRIKFNLTKDVNEDKDVRSDNDDDDDDDNVHDDDDDNQSQSPSPPSKGFQRHNSLTRKQAATIAMNRALNTRIAVSLTQLPPPIEADSENESSGNSGNGSNKQHIHPHQHHIHHHQHLHHHHQQQQQQPPPPPIIDYDNLPDNIVLAPPPQFCDAIITQEHQHQQQQQNSPRVRIVGAVPKVNKLA